MTGPFQRGYSVAFFAVSFVRSYPGDRPAFSRAGNSEFSARFYRRPGPAFKLPGEGRHSRQFRACLSVFVSPFSYGID
jgi:hypothetical protein